MTSAQQVHTTAVLCHGPAKRAIYSVLGSMSHLWVPAGRRQPIPCCQPCLCSNDCILLLVNTTASSGSTHGRISGYPLPSEPFDSPTGTLIACLTTHSVLCQRFPTRCQCIPTSSRSDVRPNTRNRTLTVVVLKIPPEANSFKLVPLVRRLANSSTLLHAFPGRVCSRLRHRGAIHTHVDRRDQQLKNVGYTERGYPDAHRPRAVARPFLASPSSSCLSSICRVCEHSPLGCVIRSLRGASRVSRS
ncbi:hypothetical protein BD414DRAFT_319612 [Trametes punicea]|nr:hypothetical protein BD414DRAFT_319612 [Trametes punicea]